MTWAPLQETIVSAICTDCKGIGLEDGGMCAWCGGTGRLYRLATPCDGEAWLSAAMLASALGKDPFDAAVIAAITDNAVLGVFLADDASAESEVPMENHLAASEPEGGATAAEGEAASSATADESDSGDSDE